MNTSRLAGVVLCACVLAAPAAAQNGAETAQTSAAATASAGQVAVVILSDPTGASLLASDGRTVVASLPVTKTFAAPTPWRSCVSYPGVTVRWSSGVVVKIGQIELCPEDGSRQQIVVSVPVAPTPTASVTAPSPSSTAVCRDGGVFYKPDNGRCATGANVPASVPASVPPAVSEPNSPTASANAPREPSGPTTLPVTMIKQTMNETGYRFIVPGTVNTYRAGSANCFGQANSALNASVYGNMITGTINTTATANCSGTSTSNTIVTPAQSVSYAVEGATLALQLPDRRVAVVNCNSKFNWTQWGGGPRRSCRIPTVTQFDAEFNGDKAKLIWRVGINGEKVVSETYDLIQILDPPVR